MVSNRNRSTTPTASPSGRASAFLRWLRSRLLMMAGAVGLALVLSACVGEVPDVPTDDAQLVRGREVYARNCVGCHGVSGQGGVGPKISDGLTVESYPEPADQATIIADGRGQMPAFVGKLSQEEIDAVVRFTRESL